MYKVNDVISVIVTYIVPYGVFTKTDDGYTGLIHISEITGSYIKDISKYFKVGNEVQARIIGIDEEKKQLSLSTKNLIADNKLKYENILEEEGQGFDGLREKLPEWIDITKKELENNK